MVNMVNMEDLLSTEQLIRRWPVDGSDPYNRWQSLLKKWRDREPPLLIRHVHFEIVFRDGHALYVYAEPRVLHLIWHEFERGWHPLCTQVMLAHGKQIKRLVSDFGKPASHAAPASHADLKS